MLPIITQSHLSKEPSFIAVEEPEVTLHPKLQIALADFITEMARKKENTYLIETHSEHLILNLLQLIKENKLHGCESSQKFYHLNTEDMYKKITNLNITD